MARSLVLAAAAAFVLGSAMAANTRPDFDNHPFQAQMRIVEVASNHTLPGYIYYDGANALFKMNLPDNNRVTVNVLMRPDLGQRYIYVQLGRIHRCRAKEQSEAEGGLIFGWVKNESDSKFTGSMTYNGQNVDVWDRISKQDSLMVLSSNPNVPVMDKQTKQLMTFEHVTPRTFASTFFAVPSFCDTPAADDDDEPNDDDAPVDDDDEPHRPPHHPPHGSGSHGGHGSGHGWPPHGGSGSHAGPHGGGSWHGHHNRGSHGGHGGGSRGGRGSHGGRPSHGGTGGGSGTPPPMLRGAAPAEPQDPSWEDVQDMRAAMEQIKQLHSLL